MFDEIAIPRAEVVILSACLSACLANLAKLDYVTVGRVDMLTTDAPRIILMWTHFSLLVGQQSQ